MMPNETGLRNGAVLRALVGKLIDLGVMSWDDYLAVYEAAIDELLDAAAQSSDLPELRDEYASAAVTLKAVCRAIRDAG